MVDDLKNREEDTANYDGGNPNWYSGRSSYEDDIKAAETGESDNSKEKADKNGGDPPKESAAEKSPATSSKPARKGSARKAFAATSNTKKFALIGGIAAALIAIIVGLLTFLAPYKITHIVENIEQSVGQVPQYAVERRMEYYMNRYIIMRTLINSGAVPDFEPGSPESFTYLGEGPFRTLYYNWRGAKLESVLINDYDARLIAKRDPRGLSTAQKLRADNWELDHGGTRRDLNSRESRQFIREFARAETKSRQVLKRHHMRKIFKRYYGVPDWKPFEQSRENVRDKYLEKRNSFKTKIIQQTVGRLTGRSALYFDCILEGSSLYGCRTSLKRADTSNIVRGTGDDTDDDRVKETLENTDIDDSEKNSRIRRIIQENVLKRPVRALAGGPIAIAFIINDAAKIIEAVDNGIVSLVVYDKNAQQYAAFAAPILSGNDQLRAGDDFDIEDARVLSEMFDDFNESPVYQANSGVLDPGRVSANGAVTRNDCIVDGEEATVQLEPGELICPEKKLLQDKTSFTDSTGWGVLSSVSGGIRNTAGEIIDVIESFIGFAVSALGLDTLIQNIMEATGLDELAARALSWISDRIFGSVINGSEVGPQAYEGLYAGVSTIQASLGGEVGVSKEDTIGGAYLSDEEVAMIRGSQMEDYYASLQQKSFIERYFSPDVKESLTGQIAMHAPTNLSSFGANMFQFASPATIFTNITKAFTPQSTNAQYYGDYNPFDVIHMGFPENHPVFTANDGTGMDYEEVVERYQCNLPVNERPQNQEESFGRGHSGEIPFDVPLEPDPCLLEETVADAGSMFFTGTYDEGIDEFSGNAQTPARTDNSDLLPSGGAQQLAQQLLDSSNVTWRNNVARGQIEEIADSGNGDIYTELIRVLVALSQQHEYAISSLRRCTTNIGAGAQSRHCIGAAADISGAGGIDGTSFDYNGTEDVVLDFLALSAQLLEAECEIGVPNSAYVNSVRPQAKSGCSVFVDTGTAPHIHLGVPR